MSEKVQITSYDQFESLMQSGKTQVQIEITLNNGKILSDRAPFDETDPMSYILARMMLREPNVKIYPLP